MLVVSQLKQFRAHSSLLVAIDKPTTQNRTTELGTRRRAQQNQRSKDRMTQQQTVHISRLPQSTTLKGKANLTCARSACWLHWVMLASLVVAHFVSSTRAEAQALATIITPPNAATNVDPGAPLTWNSVSGSQGYYVYV